MRRVSTPGDFPGGKQGQVLTVEFTVLGIPCLGLNGGPNFPHTEAFSFQVATDDQDETDRYWNAIVSNGGKESACGWCKDQWGINWQITPVALTRAISHPDRAVAKRAITAAARTCCHFKRASRIVNVSFSPLYVHGPESSSVSRFTRYPTTSHCPSSAGSRDMMFSIRTVCFALSGM